MTNFLCKGPDENVLCFADIWTLSLLLNSLAAKAVIDKVNKKIWMYSNKTLLTKTVGRLDLACGP